MSVRHNAVTTLLAIAKDRFAFETDDDWTDYTDEVDARVNGSRCHAPPPVPDCRTHEEWVELADQIYDSICDGAEDHHEESAALFEADTLGALGGLAEEIAAEMHEENFSSHRGTGSIVMAASCGVGAFYLFDSHPHALDAVRPYDASGTRRARQLAKVIAAMRARGCTLATTASYPKDGDEQGYTVALVFVSATPERAGADRAAACAEWDRVFLSRFAPAKELN